MDLYQSFFETCKADYETAKLNQNKLRDYITLYHYQQSFEKGLKALHIFRFKQIKYTNYSDNDAYSKIRTYSHNVEKSYINFVTEMAEYQKIFTNTILSQRLTNNKKIVYKMQ